MTVLSRLLVGLLALSASPGQHARGQATTQAAFPFRIETRFLGQPLTTSQQATVQEAARRVGQLITSPFQAARLNLPANDCDSGLPHLRETVKQFFVFVVVSDMGDDVYAQAAPCDLHDGSYLPIYGVVDLNSRGLDDLPRADLLDTMIHELLHALGVGTLWEAQYRVSQNGDSDNKNLIRGSGRTAQYIGPQALAAYRALGGSGDGIPLDPDLGHWAGRVVCSEILSGDAGEYTGRVNPISPLTLGALQDLGYRVNLAAASPYTLPSRGCKSQGQRPRPPTPAP